VEEGGGVDDFDMVLQEDVDVDPFNMHHTPLGEDPFPTCEVLFLGEGVEEVHRVKRVRTRVHVRIIGVRPRVLEQFLPRNKGEM
jgi:hypothetical protein